MTTTWTTKSGKTVTATPNQNMPATWLDVTVDGKPISSGRLITVADPQAAAVRQQMVAAGMTHVLACGKIPVGVPSEVAAQIQAAQKAAANRPESLESQRESLVAAIRGAGDQFEAAREYFFSEDTGRGAGKVAAAETAIKKAEKALADFDAAHPEIIAAIQAEEAEAAERFLRAD